MALHLEVSVLLPMLTNACSFSSVSLWRLLLDQCTLTRQELVAFLRFANSTLLSPWSAGIKG